MRITETCKQHGQKKAEYWCVTCDKAVCIDCIVLTHREHQFDSIAQAAAELQNKVGILTRTSGWLTYSRYILVGSCLDRE